MTCSPSIVFDVQVNLPDGSMAIAYDWALASATKSVRGMRRFTCPRGTLVFPAYGSIETRPMIHASASNVRAVRSYSAVRLGMEPQFVVTILPSIDGPMWQIT